MNDILVNTWKSLRGKSLAMGIVCHSRIAADLVMVLNSEQSISLLDFFYKCEINLIIILIEKNFPEV